MAFRTGDELYFVKDSEETLETVSGGVSRNPRFFRHSKLSGLGYFESPNLCSYRPDSTVDDVKNFPFFALFIESFGDKQAKFGLTEFSRVSAYTPGKVIPTRPEQERLLRTAGFSGDINRTLLSEGFTLLATQRP